MVEKSPLLPVLVEMEGPEELEHTRHAGGTLGTEMISWEGKVQLQPWEELLCTLLSTGAK